MPGPIAGLLLVGLLACRPGNEASLERASASQSLSSAAASAGLGAVGHAEVGSQSRTLERGALIDANMGRGISSRSTTVGETIQATVYAEALDGLGRVVLPTGAIVELMVTGLTPAGSRSGNDATITLVITSVIVGGRHYPLAAELKSMAHSLEGHRFLVGAGNQTLENSYGVVAGWVIGKDEQGIVVGGAMRPVGGVVGAFQAAGRDVVVLAGTPIVLKLTDRFTLQWR